DTNVTIDGNHTQNTKRVGVYIGTSDNVLVSNNLVKDANLNTFGAISDDNGSNITISGNTVSGGAGYGIRLNTATGTNCITGNLVDNVVQDGINVQSTPVVVVSGNQVGLHNDGADTIVSGITGNGISILDSDFAQVSGNSVNGAGLNGVLIDP